MPNSRAELNADLFDLAKRYAAKAKEALGDRLVSISLFGSVARGQAGPGSDIDLFVVLQEAPPGMLSRRRLLEPVRESLIAELERLWKQGIYADFVEVIRTRSWLRSKNNWKERGQSAKSWEISGTGICLDQEPNSPSRLHLPPAESRTRDQFLWR